MGVKFMAHKASSESDEYALPSSETTFHLQSTAVSQ